jgi:hypothetical protein
MVSGDANNKDRRSGLAGRRQRLTGPSAGRADRPGARTDNTDRERSKLWLANYEERQQALEARREARRRTRLGLPAISAKPVDVLPAEARAPTAPAPGAIMTFRQAWERYARAQRGGWDNAKRNGRTEKRYRGLVARYCPPILDMPVTEITVDDVAAVLNSNTSRGTPLWRGSDSDAISSASSSSRHLISPGSNRTPLHSRPNCANCCPRTLVKDI